MRVLSPDLETLGREPGCVVLSIGYAVADTDGGEVTESGILYPNVQEQIDHGMHVCADTIRWWVAQSPEAQRGTFIEGNHQEPVKQALVTLSRVFQPCSFVTGYGSTFDVGIIEATHRRFGVPTPWNYRGVLCLRTMCLTTGTVIDRTTGDKHNSEHDAMNQAYAFLECYLKLQRVVR